MYFTITTASGGYRARAEVKQAWGEDSPIYQVRAYGGNGEQMMTSEVYTTKQSAQRAIEVIKAQAATATVLDRT